MKTMQRYISEALFAVVLTLGISIARVPGQKPGGSVGVKQVVHDTHELQRDMQLFETDFRILKQSLRHHASQERIARVQNRVRQDWHNIVLDRGLTRLAPDEQIQNLATRHGKQVFHNRARS